MSKLIFTANMRWTVRNVDSKDPVIHIQVPSKEGVGGGNRYYGDAFDFPVSAIYSNQATLLGILQARKDNTVSLATNKPYTMGEVQAHCNLSPEHPIMRVHLAPNGCAGVWFFLTNEYDALMKEHVEFIRDNGADEYDTPAPEPEPIPISNEPTEEVAVTEHKLGIFLKNMRWTLRDADGAAPYIHIQMLAKEGVGGGNRIYGDAFDVPLTSFYSGQLKKERVILAYRGDIQSLATDKLYTKGKLVVRETSRTEARYFMHILLGRVAGCDRTFLDYITDDSLMVHAEFAVRNGLSITL